MLIVRIARNRYYKNKHIVPNLDTERMIAVARNRNPKTGKGCTICLIIFVSICLLDWLARKLNTSIGNVVRFIILAAAAVYVTSLILRAVTLKLEKCKGRQDNSFPDRPLATSMSREPLRPIEVDITPPVILQETPHFKTADIDCHALTVQWDGYIKEDEMFPYAVDVVMETGQASVSMIQRRLNLGYGRVARLMDMMEEAGIVGSFQGSKPRAILITNEQWQKMKLQFGERTQSKKTELASKPEITITVGINKPYAERRGGLGHRLDQYVRDCVILEITATGYGSDTGEIIEISAIKLRDLVVADTFSTLIKPQEKLSPEQIRSSGITNLMLAKAPGIDHVLPALWDFLEGEAIVSFRTQSTMFFLYDVFLAYTDHVLSNDYLDLQSLAWKTLPDIEPEHLSDISLRLGSPQADSTRTMGCCEVMADCYQRMAGMDDEQPAEPEQLQLDQAATPLDDLLIPAIDWIIQDKNVSTSALRKEFGIGYDKAKSLMDQIELLGVVGPSNGNKPRDVLMGVNPLKD